MWLIETDRQTAAFYFPLGRSWEFLAGVLLAFAAPIAIAPRWRRIAIVVALGALGWSSLTLSATSVVWRRLSTTSARCIGCAENTISR